MGKVVVKNAIKREKGKLYYIDKAGNVCCTEMKRKTLAKKPAAKKKAVKKK